MIAGSSVLAIYSPKPLSSYCFNLSILFSDDYGVGIYTRLRTIKMTYAASYQALIILFGLGLSERMKGERRQWIASLQLIYIFV
jgi:hypothetical protein